MRHLPGLLPRRRVVVVPEPPPAEPEPEERLLPDVPPDRPTTYEPVVTADDLHDRARQALARFFDVPTATAAEVIRRAAHDPDR